MNKIWLVTLCALLILVALFGLSIPLRIAIGANAILILADAIKRIFGGKNGRTEAKNENVVSCKKPLQ